MKIKADRSKAPMRATNSDRFEIAVPKGFNFWRTVNSHGWCKLPPFSVDREKRTLSRLLELKEGELIHCEMEEVPGGIRVKARSQVRLGKLKRDEVRAQLRHCFRLDDDLS